MADSTVPQSDTFADMTDFNDELDRLLSLASGLDPADVSRALVQAAGEVLHPEAIEGEATEVPGSKFAQEFAKLHAPAYAVPRKTFDVSTPSMADETAAQAEWHDHAGKRDDA
jgi:hypothetical protein